MEITVKGLKVNYIDNGIPGDSREVILFLHGWGAPITAYRTVLAPPPATGTRTPHGWLTMRKRHIPDYRLTDGC